MKYCQMEIKKNLYLSYSFKNGSLPWDMHCSLICGLKSEEKKCSQNKLFETLAIFLQVLVNMWCVVFIYKWFLVSPILWALCPVKQTDNIELERVRYLIFAADKNFDFLQGVSNIHVFLQNFSRIC